MKTSLLVLPLLSLTTSLAFPTGEQVVLGNGNINIPERFQATAQDYLSDAKKAILKGKKNLDKWYHDGKEYIKQNELLCKCSSSPCDVMFRNPNSLLWMLDELVSHPSFEEHQLRVTEPELCDASVQQYSGYFDIAQDKHLFYW